MARKSKAVVTESIVAEVFPKTFESGTIIERVAAVGGQHTKHGGINLTVKFAHIPVEVPFHADSGDVEEHGVWLYEEALKGAFGEVTPYDRPLPTIKDLQDELDKVWPDVVLGLATEEELSLAKALRIQIKAMS